MLRQVDELVTARNSTGRMIKMPGQGCMTSRCRSLDTITEAPDDIASSRYLFLLASRASPRCKFPRHSLDPARRDLARMAHVHSCAGIVGLPAVVRDAARAFAG